MKLISMTDYVIKTYNEVMQSLDSELMMVNYANFLKQPLNLGMFVPCDKNQIRLKEPSHYHLYKLGVCLNGSQINECYKYEIAEEKVIFKYNDIFNDWTNCDTSNSKIEDLLTDGIDYYLKS